MDQSVIDDLKQFIAATVSQQISAQTSELLTELRTELRAEIGDLEGRLTQKIDDLSSAVGHAMNDSNQSADDQLEDHERRITKLEHATA